MEKSYLLMKESGQQEEGDLTFIGGFPRMPASEPLPTCELCGEKLTFFFQVSFPEKHSWEGRTMAVFACTKCAHEDFLIPEMLQDTLKGIDIPQGFLESYQKNFRILLFETENGELRNDYDQIIKFVRWRQSPAENPDEIHAKIGGSPDWLLDNETPATYKTKVPMIFLMQLPQDMKFETVENAPPQTILNLEGKPASSRHSYYELFLANQIYFFGTKDMEPLVYILTQI
ncbi:hypothetical protein QUF79_17705 [Fictibacillus enclensis]|uniref:hypothetical protein n=1 Tax=Fictibacillus enclensis TaxID=1017270 RepID=UPI0024C069EC|nr:hypothetical protein [Fictibacillus enclensis]MDM5199850.1 hypothetical protein [Fictibacillus enclensis]WHY70618.1 hypothetical protein QNH15_16390 [Fictibacillus enclensis]